MDRHPTTSAPAAVLAALLAAGGCASDAPLARFEPRPMPMMARSNVTLRPALDASAPILLDLAGRPAAASLRHVVAAEGAPTGGNGADGTSGSAGCFASLEVATALADGSCRLELGFRARADAPGMALATARLVARAVDGTTCAPLQARLAAGDDAVAYTLDPASAAGAWLPLAPPSLDELVPGATSATIAALPVFPRGEVTLRAGDDALVLDLSTVQLGGDVVSVAAADGACTPCAEGEACRSGYPIDRMRDFQPQSPTAELRVPMDHFLGRPAVVLLTQGW